LFKAACSQYCFKKGAELALPVFGVSPIPLFFSFAACCGKKGYQEGILLFCKWYWPPAAAREEYLNSYYQIVKERVSPYRSGIKKWIKGIEKKIRFFI